MAENEIKVSFSNMLSDKLVSIKDALPKDFNQERFIQNTLAVLNDKPELLKVNRSQLLLGVVKGAMLNLDYSNKEFYLIPYGGTVQFQIDYRGMMKIAKAYSIRPIKDIQADIVREGDLINYEIKDNKPIVCFKPKLFSDAEIMGVFCKIEYEDGGITFERMSTKEVQDVRNNYSNAKNSKAWTKSFDQMMLKTCIRRSLKKVELDFESFDARKAWEEESDMDFITKEKSIEIDDPFAQAPDVVVESTVIEPEEVEDDLPEFLQGGE